MAHTVPKDVTGRLVKDLLPDIVLLDISMPGSGIEADLLAHDRFRAD